MRLSKRMLMIISCLILLAFRADAQPVHVNEPTVCLNCHSDLTEMNNKRSVHTAWKLVK